MPLASYIIASSLLDMSLFILHFGIHIFIRYIICIQEFEQFAWLICGTHNTFYAYLFFCLLFMQLSIFENCLHLLIEWDPFFSSFFFFFFIVKEAEVKHHNRDGKRKIVSSYLLFHSPAISTHNVAKIVALTYYSILLLSPHTM